MQSTDWKVFRNNVVKIIIMLCYASHLNPLKTHCWVLISVCSGMFLSFPQPPKCLTHITLTESVTRKVFPHSSPEGGKCLRTSRRKVDLSGSRHGQESRLQNANTLWHHSTYCTRDKGRSRITHCPSQHKQKMLAPLSTVMGLPVNNRALVWVQVWGWIF